MKILYRMLRRSMVNKLYKAGYGNQFIDSVMDAFGLSKVGLPRFLNPPPPPEKRIRKTVD
jgi:hypothetical protein